MKYNLFYKDLEIALITQKDQDFPNLFGHFELLDSKKLNENKSIRKYIEYSIKSNKLMEENETEWLNFIDNEEQIHLNLIESEDWYLIDDKRKKHLILVPLFCDKNEFVWRWNF